MTIDRSIIWNTILNVANDSQLIMVRLERLGKRDVKKYVDSLVAIIGRVDRPFKLGILGEFRAGKSSLINIVAGMDIALTDERETTATLNCFSYGEIKQATICYKDGSIQELSLEDANQILDIRRHEHSWLDTISCVKFTAPCDTLKRMEFWDSPGLAGSDYNETVAVEFTHHVDAVIWVFNCDFLGKSNLASVLEDLAQRGKHIIAVVNKCEERTEADFPVIKDLVRQTYRNVPFVKIIPFSAWMAKEHQQGVAESEYFGDLPTDGGLSHFMDVVEKEILNDPTRLSAESAAGDLRSVLISLHDQVHHDVLSVRRDLGLIDHMYQANTKKVSERIKRFVDDIVSDLTNTIQQQRINHIKDVFNHASVNQLRNEEWLTKQLTKTIPDEVTIRKSCSDYIIGEQKAHLAIVLSELGINQQEYLYKLLTPLDSLNSEGSIINHSCDRTVNWGKTEKTTRNWKMIAAGMVLAFASVVTAASGIVPMSITLGGASAVTFASSKSIQSLSDEDIRSSRMNDCIRAINRDNKNLQALIHNLMLKQFQSHESDIVKSLMNEQEALILKGRNRISIETENIEQENIVGELNRLVNELELAARMPSRSSTTLLNQQLTIRQGDRSQARILVDAIYVEAQRFIEITDSDFSYRMFDELLSLNEKIPVRIITWKEPLLAGIAEEFQTRMHQLRERRSGAVSVVTPKPFPSIDSSILPTGCWFFTECGAYHFNATLADVLIASRDITFTPYANDIEVHPIYFERWWKAEVDGFLCMQLT